LMNRLIAAGYADTDWSKCADIAYQMAQSIHRLPYVEELRPAYDQIIDACRFDNDLDEALRWAHILEGKAQANHDLRGQATALDNMALIWLRKGDLDKRLALDQQALELYTRIGDTKHSAWMLRGIAHMHWRQGRLQQAQAVYQQSLEILETVGMKRDVVETCKDIGRVALPQRHWEEAVDWLQKALSLCGELEFTWNGQGEAYYLLGRAKQAMGKTIEAAQLFEKAVELELSGKGVPVRALSGLEEVLLDAQAFRTLCHRFQKDYCQGLDPSFVQWYLEPAPVGTGLDGCHLEQARGLAIQSPGWTWVDPFGDGSYVTADGLDIRAASGRDVHTNSLGAPRLLRHVSGDLVVQAASVPRMEDRPAIGGLLLWKDERNFLRLERG